MFHIVTPFSRPQNLPALVSHLLPFTSVPPGIQWHPLCHDPRDLNVIRDQCENLAWVTPWLAKYPDDWSGPGCCYWKANYFFHEIAPSYLPSQDHALVLCDDDRYSEDFFPLPLHEIMVVSMHRPLEHVEGKGYPQLLIACAEKMKVGWTGFEQICMTLENWRRFRYENKGHADGLLAEQVKESQVVYLPEKVVLFNQL